MKLAKLPPVLSVEAIGEEDVPDRIEVVGPAGEPVARYTRAGAHAGCWKGCAARPALELDELPERLEVGGGPLPERLEVEVHHSSHCRHHGWLCPDWVESVLFRKA
jgi:hypothetical protein